MIPEREETTSDESETKELPPEDLEALSEPAAEAAEAQAKAEAGAEAEAKETGEDWKERYLRALAEQENVRKNTERERARERKYAEEALMRDAEFIAFLDDDEEVPAEWMVEAFRALAMEGKRMGQD